MASGWAGLVAASTLARELLFAFVVPSPSQERGAYYEALAERTLVIEGYRIVERNWVGGRGEVDRIAWEGEILCFVEVRSRRRADFGQPSETVDWKKQRKVIRAAATYLAHFPPGAVPMARFDVVSIVVEDDSLELIRNAFDAGR